MSKIREYFVIDVFDNNKISRHVAKSDLELDIELANGNCFKNKKEALDKVKELGTFH